MSRSALLTKALIIGSIAFGLSLNTATAAARPEYQFGIGINPTSGPPGTVVTVNGGGWTPNSTGNEIHWDSQSGPLLGTFSANGNGAFSTTVTIPQGPTAGAHAIWACDRCGSTSRFLRPRWVSATFTVILPPTVTPWPTATPIPPSECDATGMAGETVITFDAAAFPVLTNLEGRTLEAGLTFDQYLDAYVVDPVDAWPHSGNRGLQGEIMMEFLSSGRPIHFSLDPLAEFVGVFVGLDAPTSSGEPVTAVLTAWGQDEEGVRYLAGSDSVTLGPGVENIHRCLSVSDPRIREVFIDYPSGDPELIDDVTLRRPEIPVEPVPDDEPPQVTITLPENGAFFSTREVRLEGEVIEDWELESIEVYVNGVSQGEIGFSPAGDTEDGKKRYIFALNPVGGLLECDELIEVVARDSAGNQGDDSVGIRVLVGDLSLGESRAVQVIFGSPLVMGKNTAFQVSVSSTFGCPINVRFRLDLPEGQWDTSAIGGLRAVTGVTVPSGWRMPEDTLPLAIPAHASQFEVMLPVVPLGMEDAAWDAETNPSGLLGDIRQVPRPMAQAVSLGIEIDPGNEYAETDETNNRIEDGPYGVVDTRGISVMFVPWIMSYEPLSWATEGQYEWYLRARGYSDAAARMDDVGDHVDDGRVALWRALSAADIVRLRDVAYDWAEVFLGGFPVAETEFQAVFNPLYLYFLQDYLWSLGVTDYCANDTFRSEMRSELIAANPSLNDVVLEMIAGCCGQSGSTPETVFLDAGRGFVPPMLITPIPWADYCSGSPPAADSSGTPTAKPWEYAMGGAGLDSILHEFSHNYVGSPDCYNCWTDAGSDCNSCYSDSDGFWVNRWRLIPEPTHSFMHAVDEVNIRWWRLEPILNDAGVPDTDGYLRLVNRFARLEDPEALLVSGRLGRGQGASFGPFFVVENAVLDLESGDSGSLAFVLRDVGGRELVRVGFTPSFEVSLDPQGVVQVLDEIPFVYRIPWDASAARIELQDSQGSILATRTVSAYPPSVEILSPVGGEVWPSDREHTVRWQASDPDGDPLVALLQASLDGGQTWLPLAGRIEDDEYRLDSAAFEDGQAFLLRVVVTDGVRSASATTASELTAELAPSIPRNYRLIAVGILAVVALVVAIGVVLIWRRGARTPHGA